MGEQQDYTVKQQKICYISAQPCGSPIPNPDLGGVSLCQAMRSRRF